MGVGAGTSSGIMLGAAINNSAIVGKDAAGKNVTYGEFMSGSKQVDMKTLNMNTQIAKAADGDAITLGGVTAMPMASGISYDFVKAGLPAAVTNQNVIIGKNAIGDDVTLSQLMSGVTDKKGYDTLYKELLNTTASQRSTAQTDYLTTTLKNMGYEPDAAELQKIVASGKTGTAELSAAAKEYSGSYVSKAEATAAYAALGLAEPTKADIDKLVGQYQQELLADKAKENLGTAQFNVTAAEQEATKNAIAALETQTKAQYDTLTAEQKALADALTAQGTTLADAIAAAQESTATQISDLEAQTTEQYNTLTAAQKATADALVAQGTTLSEAIETAKTETAGAIETLSADVQAKYDALTAEQKALADAMAQQGLDLTAAIDLAAQQTQEQITGLGEQVDTRINELMQQGQTYQQATQQAIGELNQQNQQLQGLVGTQGRTANQSDIDALTQMLGGQRSMDLAYDVTGDKQITQADIDFLTQVVGGVKTDWTAPQQSPWAATGLYGQIQANELRRQQDLAAAEAQRVADQQAAAQAAAERDRQANIRTTATRAQTSAQGIMQQLEAMQRAGMAPQQPAQLVEAGPGFDLSDPLNTGFFSGFQAKKAQQNQQPTTKIAAGGYIDDLLAGDMTADDLLNLLR
jgi:hypothetical protein